MRTTYIYAVRPTIKNAPGEGSGGVCKSEARTHAAIRREQGEDIQVWRTPWTAGLRDQDWKLVPSMNRVAASKPAPVGHVSRLLNHTNVMSIIAQMEVYRRNVTVDHDDDAGTLTITDADDVVLFKGLQKCGDDAPWICTFHPEFLTAKVA